MYYQHDHFYSRQDKPPSPPWGFRKTKQITINVPFKVQSLTYVSPCVTASKNSSNISQGSIILYNLTPSISGQWITQRQKRLKAERIKNFKKTHIKKHSINSLHPQHSPTKLLKLKRLMRGPVLKTKKMEIYEKWQKRLLRRIAYRKRKWNTSSFLFQYPFSAIGGIRQNNCHAHNEQNTFDFEEEEYFDIQPYYARKRRPRSSSRLSDSYSRTRSRSPVIIRSSPL